MDSRASGVTVDHISEEIGQRAAAAVTELQVTGRGGVVAGADAVVLNITIVAPAAAGYATVYPCGAERPNSSNLNFTAGQTIANAVITKVGIDGKVCIYTHQATHLLADVSGCLLYTSDAADE